MKNMKENIKKILLSLLIVFVVVLTMTYIKRMPPVMKVMMLAVDLVVVYWAYVNLITKNKKDELKD